MRLPGVSVLILLLVGCGTPDHKPANAASSNASNQADNSSNGNNAPSNSATANNGATNNGATNNGATNNGATNNATTNSTGNNTTRTTNGTNGGDCPRPCERGQRCYYSESCLDIPPLGECYVDSDCADGETCVGATYCPPDVQCIVGTMPGDCNGR